MYEVIGVRKISYFNKKSQRQVDGIAVYVTYVADDIKGCGCKEIFISSRLGYSDSDFEFGRYFNVFYDEYKNVQFVDFVE